MEHRTRLSDPGPARAFAWVSGVVGFLAGAFLLGFFALDSYGVRFAGFSLGYLNDILGAVQFASLAPVVWALGRRLPATRTVRVATMLAVAASVTFAVLSVLLIAETLTFSQQIGPAWCDDETALRCLYQPRHVTIGLGTGDHGSSAGHDLVEFGRQ